MALLTADSKTLQEFAANQGVSTPELLNALQLCPAGVPRNPSEGQAAVQQRALERSLHLLTTQPHRSSTHALP